MGLFTWGSMMKGFLPGVVELSILASMAILSAAILISSGIHELAIVLAAFPLILVASLLGAKRSGKLSQPVKVTVVVERTNDSIRS